MHIQHCYSVSNECMYRWMHDWNCRYDGVSGEGRKKNIREKLDINYGIYLFPFVLYFNDHPSLMVSVSLNYLRWTHLHKHIHFLNAIFRFNSAFRWNLFNRIISDAVFSCKGIIFHNVCGLLKEKMEIRLSKLENAGDYSIWISNLKSSIVKGSFSLWLVWRFECLSLLFRLVNVTALWYDRQQHHSNSPSFFLVFNKLIFERDRSLGLLHVEIEAYCLLLLHRFWRYDFRTRQQRA